MMDSPLEKTPLLENFVKGDDAYRNSRFKRIPYIQSINYFHGNNCFEIIENLANDKEIDLDELEGRANKGKIQKHYKILGLQLGISSLADSITRHIAGRDAL